ncbi:hypothetical protein SEA_ANNADREAMY_182 [Streptomyces phage Annadreamy]|uniref:Uncharacterized protein n=2 Tax=Annadreamyvirus annadreamy TaxID=2846392 RepID=A0A345GTJ5_9CAUD|nr:hypothetical protein HWB75_gp096 [Streptomyces phage Annadreamy]AXG66267.1 hypothetical protein SEA_ANNADREAMY_182 [Streptomyces phage Annadreamy]QGH79490.1 hypothetical protein SEA_LIMPID_189 [Streptomyces phage Limpid]
MIALLMTIYLIGAIVMGAYVLFAAMMGAMFGTLPVSDLLKVLFVAAIWPVAVIWGVGNVLYQKVRN